MIDCTSASKPGRRVTGCAGRSASGERVKTNRRDAVTLARLHRAGELTGIWVPDVVHEAVRDLVRSREAAADDLRRKRQQLLSFLLCHGRIYEDGGHWTLAHRSWLARQSFEHTAQQIVFQEKIDAIEDAAQRLRRRDEQLRTIVPTWSLARVVEAYQAMRGASFLVPGDLRGRDRRCAPLRYAAAVDGFPRLGSGRALDWRHGPPVEPNARRQSTRPPRLDRSGLDLPLSRQDQRSAEAPARGADEGCRRHRLEGTGTAVRPLSSPHSQRQEAAGGRGCDRARDGRLPVGHRPGGRTVITVSTQPRCTALGGGATVGNSRR